MCNEINNSKAIVLWGRENTGKTTTLNLLVYKLINIGANVLFGNFSRTVLINNYLTENHYAVFEYDSKKIAVITAGDNDKTLDDYFSKIDCDCDIYVCACRTKGCSCNYIKTLFSENNILWIEKYSVTGNSKNIFPCLKAFQYCANETQAGDILKIIHIL